MIRRIELVDFMAHSHTVIEPAKGLTVLVGPNNSGKSAVVVALQILCSNDNSTFVTRHGARKSSVIVETDDGHTIEWRREAGSVQYVIDGLLHDRLGGRVPDTLHKILRLAPVASERHTFDVHFGEQKSPIFLLDKPSSHAAQFFASSSDAIRLMDMQARHRQKVADARRGARRLQSETEQLEHKLQILEPVDRIHETLRLVERDYTTLLEAGRDIDTIEQAILRLRQLIDIRAHHVVEAASIQTLRPPPLLADPRPLASLISSLDIALAAQQKASAVVTAVEELVEPPRMADAHGLENLANGLEQYEQFVSFLRAEQQAIEPLAPPPVLVDTAKIAVTSAHVETAMKKVEVMEHKVRVLGDLVRPPQLENTSALQSWLTDHYQVASLEIRLRQTHELLDLLQSPPALKDLRVLAELTSRLGQAASDLTDETRRARQANAHLALAEQALRKWATDNRLCPTCGGAVDPDNLISQVSSGLEGHTHA